MTSPEFVGIRLAISARYCGIAAPFLPGKGGLFSRCPLYFIRKMIIIRPALRSSFNGRISTTLQEAVEMRYLVFLLLISSASAETIRFDLPQLEATYNYGQKINIPSLNLDQVVSSISNMQLEISGTQQMGWWRGDMVEDHSNGPNGGCLYAEMNTPSDPTSPALGDTLNSRYSATNDGDFTTVMSFHRLGGGAPKWSQSTNLFITNELILGWGGFTTPPVYTLTNVTLIVTGTALPEPSLLCLCAPVAVLIFVMRKKGAGILFSCRQEKTPD